MGLEVLLVLIIASLCVEFALRTKIAPRKALINTASAAVDFYLVLFNSFFFGGVASRPEPNSSGVHF